MRGKSLGNIVSGKCAAGILGAFCLVAACANRLWAQSHDEALKTFTAPDGAFSFRYSNNLVHCERKKQGSGDDYYWAPGDTCAAYNPVCDDIVGQHQTSIACFAYPQNKFTNTRAFEAATFSVEVINDSATEKSCLAGPPDAERRSTTTIHGVSFRAFEVGQAAMNQGVDDDVYRTFHKGKCYQLGIDVATANAEIADPPERELTDADWHEVNGRLEQARDSFRFLK